MKINKGHLLTPDNNCWIYLGNILHIGDVICIKSWGTAAEILKVVFGEALCRGRNPDLYTIFDRKGNITLSHMFHDKRYAFHIPTVDTLYPFSIPMD